MSKYRDELVQTIKLMGQELIDRAESMVHEDCDMITNFNINIDIPNPNEAAPELTWSTSALSKNFYNKEIGHSAGDAKMETHVESVTVEYPIKDHELCTRCAHGYVNNPQCQEATILYNGCDGCDMQSDSGSCKCFEIPVDEPCPYFKESK